MMMMRINAAGELLGFIVGRSYSWPLMHCSFPRGELCLRMRLIVFTVRFSLSLVDLHFHSMDEWVGVHD